MMGVGDALSAENRLAPPADSEGTFGDIEFWLSACVTYRN